MPVVYGDRFVGRIETIIDKERKSLVVKNLWWESDVRKTKKLNNALDKTLKEFAAFNNCLGYVMSQDNQHIDKN